MVVDDGSTDATAQMIEDEFTEVFLIREKGNLFWAAAINTGIRYALTNKARLILTLNNDTLVPETFLENMILWNQKKHRPYWVLWK